MTTKRTVLCFCKYPEPNMVKSRLADSLGADRAANIYKILLENTLHSICKKEFEVVLYCYPDTNHSLFNHYKKKYRLSLCKQDGSDLGSRMFSAMNEYLKSEHPVVLIGSDCPELDFNYIKDAFLVLEAGSDIVLGPTLDGGYALIGANRVDASIFNNISWGACNVLQLTKKNIKHLGWTVVDLPFVRDIDTLADYEYFSQHEKFKHLFLDANKIYTSTC